MRRWEQRRYGKQSDPCALASFEPRHSRGHQPAGNPSESQPGKGDRHIETQPVSTLDATGNTPQHAPSINQAHIERYPAAQIAGYVRVLGESGLGWVRA